MTKEKIKEELEIKIKREELRLYIHSVVLELLTENKYNKVSKKIATDLENKIANNKYGLQVWYSIDNDNYYNEKSITLYNNDKNIYTIDNKIILERLCKFNENANEDLSNAINKCKNVIDYILNDSMPKLKYDLKHFENAYTEIENIREKIKNYEKNYSQIQYIINFKERSNI